MVVTRSEHCVTKENMFVPIWNFWTSCIRKRKQTLYVNLSHSKKITSGISYTQPAKIYHEFNSILDPTAWIGTIETETESQLTSATIPLKSFPRALTGTFCNVKVYLYTFVINVISISTVSLRFGQKLSTTLAPPSASH